jgi:hypothetical protein
MQNFALIKPFGLLLWLFDPHFLPKLLKNAFIAGVSSLLGAKNMSEQDDKSKAALHEYVTVAIAEDADLANEYRDILAKNDIPAVTATQRSYSSVILGVAVMVPETYLEQAQEIIESRQEFDHFIDDTFNDPDEMQGESDMDYLDDDEFGEEIY